MTWKMHPTIWSMPLRKGVFFGDFFPLIWAKKWYNDHLCKKKMFSILELEKCILHGGWNANDTEVEPEPSFLQSVAFVVADESIKPRFAQTFRANISIGVFYFARRETKSFPPLYKEYEDLKWKIQYWWFSTLPAIVKVILYKRNKSFFSSSLPKSPFLPLSLSWHYIHLANLLLSCTNISNHYFPSNLIQYESK